MADESIADLIDGLGPLWLQADLEQMAAGALAALRMAGFIADRSLRQRVIDGLLEGWALRMKARLMDAIAGGEMDTDTAVAAAEIVNGYLERWKNA